MLGSNFFEALVPKQNTGGKAIATAIVGIVVTLLLAIVSILMQMYLLLILAMAAGFATWYLTISCQVEYEYVIAEDEFTITKVIAQSRRKPMVSTSLQKMTAFGHLSEASPLPDSHTLVLACATQDNSAYYAEFPHESYGNVRLIFTPDDRFLTYFAKHLPRNLQFRYESSGSDD